MDSSRSGYSNAIVILYKLFIIFAMVLTQKVYAKESIEKIIEKHMKDVDKYKKNGDVERLIYKMIAINRDIDIFYKKDYDYKVLHTLKLVDSFVE